MFTTIFMMLLALLVIFAVAAALGQNNRSD
jgi:hypothetical protein